MLLSKSGFKPRLKSILGVSAGLMALSKCDQIFTAHLFSDSRTDATSLIPEYYLRYTRFCLYTHFVRHIKSTGLRDGDQDAVQRCFLAARDVLALSQRLGPAARDQLRYFNGYLVVMLYFCCSFILNTISAFPPTVQDIPAALELVNDVADLLTDLGFGNSSGGLNAGEILRFRTQKLADDGSIQGSSQTLYGSVTNLDSLQAVLSNSPGTLRSGDMNSENTHDTHNIAYSHHEVDPFGFEADIEQFLNF